jgi:L-lactate dehydrogenase
VHAYIVGEHGDSQVPLWSRTNISGRPFREFCAECTKKCDKPDLEDLREQTMTAGAQIIAAKGATFFGIAMSAARIIEAIMNDENAVLTVSSVLSGAYGISGVALSVPSVINRNGISRIVDIQPDAGEMIKLKESGESLKAVLSQVY